jgi:hypothetical protein
MKMSNFLILISIFLIGVCCSKKDSESIQDKLVGTWVEKNPEMFDGISDTLVFTDDFIVRKHFYFNGWKYNLYYDTISFQKEGVIKKFMFSYNNVNELIIYNFLDRSITSQVKDIRFTKNK